MPRYRFQLNECGKITEDAMGHQIRDLAGARTVALDAARDIMAGAVRHGHLCLACRIDIVDEHGAAVMSVPFREALTIEDPAQG